MGELTLIPPDDRSLSHTIITADGTKYSLRASGEDGIRIASDNGAMALLPHVSNVVSIHSRKGYDK